MSFPYESDNPTLAAAGSQPFHTGHSCEVCGGSMVIEDNADGLIYDDQECWCELCGFESRTVVDEQGQTGIQMGVFDSENNEVRHEERVASTDWLCPKTPKT